jgi:hypothetical protein
MIETGSKIDVPYYTKKRDYPTHTVRLSSEAP